MAIKNDNRNERLQSFFTKGGFKSFSELQKLEFAIYFISPGIANIGAKRLIEGFGSVSETIRAHPDKLKEIGGIDHQTAMYLNFLREFSIDQMSPQKRNQRIVSTKEAVDYLRDTMKHTQTEEFVLICLDANNNIILEQKISSVDMNKVQINLRQILDIVLRVKTSTVIMAHSHPSDSVSPSKPDIYLTRYFINTLLPLSINVMDHIIFGTGDAVYSFSEHSLLTALKKEHKGILSSEDYEDYLMLELRERREKNENVQKFHFKKVYP